MTETTSTSAKQLRRSRTDRKLAGVCGGVADYFTVDANVVRLAFVLGAVFTGGWALIAYPIAWLLMPEEPGAPVPPWGNPPAGWSGYPNPPAGWTPPSSGWTGYPAPPAAPTVATEPEPADPEPKN